MTHDPKLRVASRPALWLRNLASGVFLVAFLCLSGLLVVAIDRACGPAGSAALGARNHQSQWAAYFQSGHLMADARTAAHMLAYLLEPEPGRMPTNSVVRG